MYKGKSIIFMLLLGSITILSCSNTTKQNETKSETTKKSETMKVIHLTKEEFITKVSNYEASPNEWKYLGDKPCIVDFYASWCPPCKILSPILDELAAKYANEIYIYKVNTEEEPELATAFGIRSIPTLFFISMDKKPHITQGAMPKNQLEKVINETLLGK